MKVNAIAYAKLVACLRNGASVSECVEETGLAAQTCWDYINALRNEGICFIKSYTEDAAGRIMMPVHLLGEGTDAKLKKTVSNTESCRRYRQKKRAARLLGILNENRS